MAVVFFLSQQPAAAKAAVRGPALNRREGFGFASRNASGETNLCVEKDLFDICPNLSKFVGNFPGLILGDVMCVCVCVFPLESYYSGILYSSLGFNTMRERMFIIA
jgi:hypothetical protein